MNASYQYRLCTYICKSIYMYIYNDAKKKAGCEKFFMIIMNARKKLVDPNSKKAKLQSR